MSNLFFSDTGYKLTANSLYNTTPDSFIFSNAGLYCSFSFALMRQQIVEDRAFYFINPPYSASRCHIRRFSCGLINSHNGISYKQRYLSGVFTIENYFCCYFDRISNHGEILFSLVVPSFQIVPLRLSRKPKVPDTLVNPNTYIPHSVRRGYSPTHLSMGGTWTSVDNYFLEFWVHEKLSSRLSKLLPIGFRKERTLANHLIRYMAACGIKILYKTDDEMNSLLYRPKVDAYSIQQLKSWKANIVQMTLDSMYNPINNL